MRALLSNQLTRLGISSMVPHNRSPKGPILPFRSMLQRISTGISAYDRAATIKILSNPNANPEELVQPGHVFPLKGLAQASLGESRSY